MQLATHGDEHRTALEGGRTQFFREYLMVMSAAPIHAWIDREVVVEQCRALG